MEFDIFQGRSIAWEQLFEDATCIVRMMSGWTDMECMGEADGYDQYKDGVSKLHFLDVFRAAHDQVCTRNERGTCVMKEGRKAGKKKTASDDC